MTIARDRNWLGAMSRRRPARAAIAPVAVILALAVAAAPAGPARGTDQKAAVPRFASLRHDLVNMRTGPGLRHPIRWVYRRRGLPVEILRDYDIWRYVRDPWGAHGWIHVRNLSSERTVLVVGSLHRLRAEPSDKAQAVARVEPAVIGRLEACRGQWCRLSVGDYAGWLRRRDLWGVYPHETVQ